MMKSQPKFEPCDKYERLLEQKVKKFFCGQLRDSCFEKVLNLDREPIKQCPFRRE